MARPTRDQWGLAIAAATATRSTCLRRHVGCVLTDKRGHILATGYNGVAAWLAHCNGSNTDMAAYRAFGTTTTHYPHACPSATAPSGTQLDGCRAIHAEQNALIQCRDAWAIDTCYVTASPCVTCVKMLLNTSCQRIVFDEEYPHTEAKLLWENAGRIWLQLGGK